MGYIISPAATVCLDFMITIFMWCISAAVLSLSLSPQSNTVHGFSCVYFNWNWFLIGNGMNDNSLRSLYGLAWSHVIKRFDGVCVCVCLSLSPEWVQCVWLLLYKYGRGIRRFLIATCTKMAVYNKTKTSQSESKPQLYLYMCVMLKRQFTCFVFIKRVSHSISNYFFLRSIDS